MVSHHNGQVGCFKNLNSWALLVLIKPEYLGVGCRSLPVKGNCDAQALVATLFALSKTREGPECPLVENDYVNDGVSYCRIIFRH